MLEIDWSLQFWTIVTFMGLLALLARFVFRPLQDILEKREAAIRDSLAKAEQARSEAEKLLEENDRKLSDAREETRRIINEGHDIAERMRKEAEQQARANADVMVRQARTEIDREMQKSLDELRAGVANLAVRISRQVIKEEMDDEKHRKLADNFVDRLKKTGNVKRDS